MESQSKEPRFYKEPTAEEINKYGLAVATARMRVRAEKISSRILSATLALLGGTAIYAVNVHNGTTVEEKVSYFITPAAIQLLAEARTERVQRRELSQIEKVGNSIRHDLNELIRDNERLSQENEQMRTGNGQQDS